MKRLVISWALTLVAAITMTTAAQAQDFEDEERAPGPAFRQGLWMSIGGGWGSQGCSACTDRLNGVSGSLVLGGSLSEQFLVGMAVGGWMTTADDGTRLSVLMADCRFRVYPAASGKWFITFGAGMSTVSDEVFGPGVLGEFGTAFLIGTGFDVRVASGVSITPYIGIMGAKTENLDANIGHAGLAITFH